MKNLLKVTAIIVWLTLFVLWYWYYQKIHRDLTSYGITEKIVVKFEDDNKEYLVNLNNWEYSTYSWVFETYPYNYKTYQDDRAIKYFNNSLVYYIEYKPDVYNLKIYNNTWEIRYTFLHPWYHEAYWSKNWKYLITKEWYTARMFWLFLAKKTAFPILNIIEVETWRNKQLLLLDKDSKTRSIEKILWYYIER